MLLSSYIAYLISLSSLQFLSLFFFASQKILFLLHFRPEKEKKNLFYDVSRKEQKEKKIAEKQPKKKRKDHLSYILLLSSHYTTGGYQIIRCEKKNRKRKEKKTSSFFTHNNIQLVKKREKKSLSDLLSHLELVVVSHWIARAPAREKNFFFFSTSHHVQTSLLLYNIPCEMSQTIFTREKKFFFFFSHNMESFFFSLSNFAPKIENF